MVSLERLVGSKGVQPPGYTWVENVIQRNVMITIMPVGESVLASCRWLR